jgi:hypothetical protein
MSRSSERRMRQVKRRVGRRPEHLIVAAIYFDGKFFFHFRKEPVYVVELTDKNNIVKREIEKNYWREFLEEKGCYYQKLIGAEGWFNRRATLEDIVKVGVQKVTLVPTK